MSMTDILAPEMPKTSPSKIALTQDDTLAVDVSLYDGDSDSRIAFTLRSEVVKELCWKAGQKVGIQEGSNTETGLDGRKLSFRIVEGNPSSTLSSIDDTGALRFSFNIKYLKRHEVPTAAQPMRRLSNVFACEGKLYVTMPFWFTYLNKPKARVAALQIGRPPARGAKVRNQRKRERDDDMEESRPESELYDDDESESERSPVDRRFDEVEDESSPADQRFDR